jgi:hypothetical protein
VPDDVLGVCLALASRLKDGAQAVAAETIGAYSVTYANTAPAFTPEELAVLDAYRLPPLP